VNKRKFSRLLVSSLALAVLVVLPVASAYSQTDQAPAPAAASTDSYDEMVKKVESGDLSVNFAELRMKYAASPQYEPEEGSDEVKDMYGKLNARDFKGALATANRVLAKQYVNINAHIVASAAYDGLHDDAAAKLHHDIVVGLVRSILDSGAGTSIGTAYKVISVQEEYAVMRILGLRPSSQSYLHNGKKTYDKMEMVNMKDNSTVTRYFDVTLSDQNLEKSLQH
jgi:Domain of unknown function (DUF4919)